MEIIFFSVLLFLSLFLVIKSADFAIRYSTRLAEGFHLPRYIVGFLIVAVISIMPETFIAITSALEGTPSLGLGTIFGSNIADLTLVFAFVIFVSGHSLKVESKLIKNRFLYIIIMLIPIILGINGYYSRIEGLVLILIGLLFYLYIFKSNSQKGEKQKKEYSIKTFLLLFVSMAVLLLGAHFTVVFGVEVAHELSLSPTLIGLFIIGLGTTLPELFFSIKAAKHHRDDLALGDILGTVIADATIVIGIVALINPFTFNPRIIYISGILMVFALVLLLHFMKTGKVLSKHEAYALILFYVTFVVAELLVYVG